MVQREVNTREADVRAWVSVEVTAFFEVSRVMKDSDVHTAASLDRSSCQHS